MINRSELKLEAKKVLSGSLIDYCVLTLLYLMVAALNEKLGGLLYILVAAVVLPAITMLLTKASLRGIRTGSYKLTEFNMDGFVSFWVKWFVMQVIVGGVAVIAPVMISIILGSITTTFAGLTTILFLAVLAGMILAVYFSLELALVPYISIDRPDLSISETLRLSSELMKNHKTEVLTLWCSFILWGLLVAVTFGIASIYVIPYFHLTMANYYNKR